MVAMKARATLQCSAQQSACVHDLQVEDEHLSSSLHSRHLLADGPPIQPTTDSPTWTLPSLDQVSPVIRVSTVLLPFLYMMTPMSGAWGLIVPAFDCCMGLADACCPGSRPIHCLVNTSDTSRTHAGRHRCGEQPCQCSHLTGQPAPNYRQRPGAACGDPGHRAVGRSRGKGPDSRRHEPR